MGLWASMKWVAREGTGVGASQRFGRLIFAGPRPDSAPRPGLRVQFLAAADAAVGAYGPPWSRRLVLGRALGVWLLAALWVVPPVLVVGRTAILASHRFQHGGQRRIPARQESKEPGAAHLVAPPAT